MKSKSNESLLFDYPNDVKLQELPIFNLEELATATRGVARIFNMGGPIFDDDDYHRCMDSLYI